MDDAFIFKVVLSFLVGDAYVSGIVWAAPAYAWVTDGSMNNVMAKWVDNIVAASKGEFPNKVNQ